VDKSFYAPVRSKFQEIPTYPEGSGVVSDFQSVQQGCYRCVGSSVDGIQPNSVATNPGDSLWCDCGPGRFYNTANIASNGFQSMIANLVMIILIALARVQKGSLQEGAKLADLIPFVLLVQPASQLLSLTLT